MPTQTEIVDILVDQLARGKVTFTHAPEFWEKCLLPFQLKWDRVLFTPDNRKGIPATKAGVYCFILVPALIGPPGTSYLMYVGKTLAFKRRYGRYLSDQSQGYKNRPHINLMLNKWPDMLWFYYASIDDRGMLDEVETTLRDSCIPPFNYEFKGRVNTAVRLWRNLGSFR